MKAHKKSVLLVDDEHLITRTSRLALLSAGIGDVLTLNDSREILPLLAAKPVSVIIVDLHMPHLSGQEILAVVKRDYPHIPVMVMTANDEVDTVVECMKLGAFDYLAKPVENGRLISSVRKALELADMSDEMQSLKQRLLSDNIDHPSAFSSLVSNNRKMRALFQYVEVVAPTRQPILITGETGTGKELLARAVHALSGLRGEFVAINVAGLDDTMFSDTLFGHKKGAFTGADSAREGIIARAAGGTLFLDEIGDLSEQSQIKLLRLLQEKEYYPVGSDMIQKSSARIVLATNRDLQKDIAAGRFRNDLYYRLCAHQVHIPPLRERLDDVPLLLDHFLEMAARALHKKKPAVAPEVENLLSGYSFPGNVRELEAIVFDALTRLDSDVLPADTFRSAIGVAVQPHPAPVEKGIRPDDPLSNIFGHFPTLDEVEEYMIREAMKLSKGNQGTAAGMLGIGRQTLNKKLKR